jgi:hypothetical protein
MLYLNIETNEYPRYTGDLELLGWKLGEDLPSNWVQVIQEPTPTVEEDETYFLEFPQLIDGIWKAVWTIRKLTPEELELKNNPIEPSFPFNLFYDLD